MLFVGIVIDPGVVAGTNDEMVHDARLRVDEVLAGAIPDHSEVIVAIEGSWLKRGHSYLIDAVGTDNGGFELRICGASGEVTSEPIAGILEYLRQRRQGKTDTSLTINVTSGFKPVRDVEITISSANGRLIRRTGLDGIATFGALKPAKYRVDAILAHYHLDPENRSDGEVEVLQGACANSRIAMRAEAEVSGLVRDAKGTRVPFLSLQLVSENQAGRRFNSEPWLEAETNADGQFRFQEVSPGRYYLGTNIVDYTRTSSMPRTYYAGQRSLQGATPIDVKLGEATENLIFVLPDFGPLRVIQLCVVDEGGAAVTAAGIHDSYEKTGGEFATLGKMLKTDKTGCVTARGYAQAAYAVIASLAAPGGDFRQTRISDSLIITPGERPIRQVLTLKKPLGVPKFTKQ